MDIPTQYVIDREGRIAASSIFCQPRQSFLEDIHASNIDVKIKTAITNR